MKLIFLITDTTFYGGLGCLTQLRKGTIQVPVKFGLSSFSGFRGEDLNVKSLRGMDNRCPVIAKAYILSKNWT